MGTNKVSKLFSDMQCTFIQQQSELVIFSCRMAKALKLLRLLKMSKIGRNVHFSNFFSAVRCYVYTPFACAVSVFLLAAIVAHWSACMFHFVAYLDAGTSYTWLHASGMTNKGNAERCGIFLRYNLVPSFLYWTGSKGFGKSLCPLYISYIKALSVLS